MVDVMQQSRDVTSETAKLGFVNTTKDTKNLHGRTIHERGFTSAVRPKRAWGKPVEQNGFNDRRNIGSEHAQPRVVSCENITKHAK